MKSCKLNPQNIVSKFTYFLIIHVLTRKTASIKADITKQILLTKGILESPGSGFFKLNTKATRKKKIIAAI